MKLRKFSILLISVCIGGALLGGCGKMRPENGTEPPALADTNTLQPGTLSPAAQSPDALLPEATDKDIDKDVYPNSSADNAGGTNNSIDANTLYADLSLNGTVVEFSSDGCIVIPIINEEAGDGSMAWQAVPGTEDKGKNVTVAYNDDCVFQIAVINAETGKAKLSDASKENIKKQTTLMLYGEYQDTYHLNVSRVVIQRFEEASK